jgi:hypothetical protein
MSARSLRAIFFDAGNTLIHMDFEAITAALAREGVAATVGDVQRAEWRARVRLDATFHPGASTEHPDTGDRYLVFVLDELGVRSQATVAALTAWRRSHNPPNGLWTVLEPQAEAALALARRAGLAAAVATWTSSSTRSGSVSRNPTPASSRSPSSAQASRPTRPPTSATSTPSTSSAPAPRACARSSWIPAAAGRRATARPLPPPCTPSGSCSTAPPPDRARDWRQAEERAGCAGALRTFGGLGGAVRGPHLNYPGRVTKE